MKLLASYHQLEKSTLCYLKPTGEPQRHLGTRFTSRSMVLNLLALRLYLYMVLSVTNTHMVPISSGRPPIQLPSNF